MRARYVGPAKGVVVLAVWWTLMTFLRGRRASARGWGWGGGGNPLECNVLWWAFHMPYQMVNVRMCSFEVSQVGWCLLVDYGL